MDAESKKVVYGFEIDRKNPKPIPCIGRPLPQSNYYVDISFFEMHSARLDVALFVESFLGASLLFCLFLIGLPFLKKREAPFEDRDVIKIPDAQLDFRANEILVKNKRIKLTSKEAQILKILVDNEGNLVTRDHLTQEVWLKEGVVTSRSLDMYISRLRKKIKELPNAQILNRHGKGYVLHVK